MAAAPSLAATLDGALQTSSTLPRGRQIEMLADLWHRCMQDKSGALEELSADADKGMLFLALLWQQGLVGPKELAREATHQEAAPSSAQETALTPEQRALLDQVRQARDSAEERPLTAFAECRERPGETHRGRHDAGPFAVSAATASGAAGPESMKLAVRRLAGAAAGSLLPAQQKWSPASGAASTKKRLHIMSTLDDSSKPSQHVQMLLPGDDPLGEPLLRPAPAA